MTDEKLASRDSNVLTKLSRWAIALAAALLAVPFVLPVWRIDLVAPQYPEGLGMLIRVNTITGLKPADLDNINGLNHYIGMKAIVPDQIPVLHIMPTALVVLIIAGFLVAVYGRRWAAWTWVSLVAAGGAAAMFEFWRWSYDYGHNLSPDAIIKIPGMTYQPPLIGTKQLLNFTAASWPAPGGVAAALAFLIAVVALLISRQKPSLTVAVRRVFSLPVAAKAAAFLVLALVIPPTSVSAQLDSVVVSPRGVTLADALRLVKPGGVVVVTAGTYAVSGITVNRPVTITGRGLPLLDGRNMGELINVTADDVTISGLRLARVGSSYTQDPAAIRVSNARNCRIIDNRIDDGFFGIYLARVTGCRISGNVLRAVNRLETKSGNGIHLWSTRNVTIADNSVTGFRDGIYFEFVHDTEVLRNVSEKNLRYGLHFMYSDDCSYVGNTFRHNGSGVAVMYTKRVHMTANRFERNWGTAAYGLLLKEISDSRLDRNVFEQNTAGLFADGADRVRAVGNTFVGNGYAVRLSGSTQDGLFTGNNFIDNTFDVTTNSHDPSTKFEANFWDSYRGYDLDRNGVGDIPHPPVRLFSVILERSPQAIVLLRSALAALLDAAERAMPSLTPELFVDPKPAMRRLS